MHFMGNCLVLTAMKMKPGRGFTRCVKHELSPRKWHHVAISHVYSRWGRSEIHCYIDGHLAEAMEMTWLVNTTDVCSLLFSPLFFPISPLSSTLTSASSVAHPKATSRAPSAVRWARCTSSPKPLLSNKLIASTVSAPPIRATLDTKRNATYRKVTRK